MSGETTSNTMKDRNARLAAPCQSGLIDTKDDCSVTNETQIGDDSKKTQSLSGSCSKESTPTQKLCDGVTKTTILSPKPDDIAVGYSNITSKSPMSLVNLGNALVQARRFSQSHACQSPASSNSLMSTRRRFPRRSSQLSDMVLTKSPMLPDNLFMEHNPNNKRSTKATTEEAQALGYGDTDDALGYSSGRKDLGYNNDINETSKHCLGESSENHQPARKRFCRYQRRNSFVVPETSRSHRGGAGNSNFSYKAMDFLYGMASKPDTKALSGTVVEAAIPASLPAVADA